MSETNGRLDLEKVKRYDDSWWLHYLKENTVFDTEQIKAQKDYLIEQAERVRESESERDEYKRLHKNYLDKFTSAVGERNRLREALEEVLDLSKHDCESRYLDKCYVVARKALEGTK